MKLSWTKNATIEITNIKKYIENDSKYYGKIFIEKIIDRVEYIKDFPEISRIVPELNNKNIREMLYKGYRIIYRILKEEIQILSIIHGSKELNSKNLR